MMIYREKLIHLFLITNIKMEYCDLLVYLSNL